MAMTCIYDEQQYAAVGIDLRRAYILATETPQALPTTGEGIDRLPDEVVLDTGSVVKCLDTGKKHILYGEQWYDSDGQTPDSDDEVGE